MGGCGTYHQNNLKAMLIWASLGAQDISLFQICNGYEEFIVVYAASTFILTNELHSSIPPYTSRYLHTLIYIGNISNHIIHVIKLSVK